MTVLQAATSNCAGSGLIDPICQGVTSLGSSIVSSSTTSIFDALSSWVGAGSTWLLKQVGSAMNSTTSISLNAPWFSARYHAAEALLGVIALPLLLAVAIQAIVQQRPGLLLRAAVVQLPLAMVLAGAAVELTTMALQISDDLSAALCATSPGSIQDLMTSIASSIQSADAATGSTIPAFIGLLGALVLSVAALTLWIELIIRAAAIYVSVAFLPLVLISLIWPSLASWSRRLIETLAALILSKMVVMVVLVMAVGALGDQHQQGFATIVTGIGLLLLAAFAPFSLLRLLPLFESSSMMALEGLRNRATSSVLHGMPRQAVQVAMGLPVWSGSAESSFSLLAAHNPLRDASTTVGVHRDEDPMTSSAVNNARSRPPSPTRMAQNNQTPGHEDVKGPPASTTNIRLRPTSLILEHDDLGPLIRPRPGEGD